MLTGSFKIAQFEGPLELLVHLVEQGEINALDLMLQQLTLDIAHFSKTSGLNETAESIFLTASLIFLKSEQLLPKKRGEDSSNTDAIRAEIIAKIVELYTLKEQATTLQNYFETGSYTRGRFYEERSKILALPGEEFFAELFTKIVDNQKLEAPPK